MDIEVLVAHFLKKHHWTHRSEVPQVAPETRVLLKAYPWPGNVRELENVIQRAFYAAKGEMLLPEHLPEEIRMPLRHPVNIRERLPAYENEGEIRIPIGTTLAAVEEKLVRETVAWLDGNQTQVARVLGIHRRTLQRKLKKYNLL